MRHFLPRAEVFQEARRVGKPAYQGMAGNQVFGEPGELIDKPLLVPGVIGLFPEPERRGERRHHRLRFRQSALGREGVRARGARAWSRRQDRRDPRSRSGVSRRSHRAARRRRLRRLPPRARCGRRHDRGDDGSGAQQGAAVLRHLRRHAADGRPRPGARQSTDGLGWIAGEVDRSRRAMRT